MSSLSPSDLPSLNRFNYIALSACSSMPLFFFIGSYLFPLFLCAISTVFAVCLCLHDLSVFPTVEFLLLFYSFGPSAYPINMTFVSHLYHLTMSLLYWPSDSSLCEPSVSSTCGITVYPVLPPSHHNTTSRQKKTLP